MRERKKEEEKRVGGGAVDWWIEADETGKIPGLEPSKAIRCSPASMVQSVTVFRQEISSFLYSCSVHRRTVVGGRVGVAWSSDRMSNWVRVVLYLFRWWRSRSVHCIVLLFFHQYWRSVHSLWTFRVTSTATTRDALTVLNKSPTVLPTAGSPLGMRWTEMYGEHVLKML